MKKTLASIAVVALDAVPGVAHAGEADGYRIGTENCYVEVEEPAYVQLSNPPRLVIHPDPVSTYCPNA